MDYKRNVQAISAYVAACNIECYKCHNYGHIASHCKSMIDTSMKENIDIRYKKVWIRKHEEKNEQRLGPIDHNIGNKRRWRKLYREKERFYIQKSLENNWKKRRENK